MARLNILAFENDSRKCFIIDIASPGDKQVAEIEQEKKLNIILTSREN